MTYCSSCGKQINEAHIFCPSCGTKKESVTLPKDTKQKKFESIVNKFSIIMGIFVLLSGIIASNLTNTLMGIALFAIGFVSLKTNSKTVKQLITIISAIIAFVAVFNLTTLF